MYYDYADVKNGNRNVTNMYVKSHIFINKISKIHKTDTILCFLRLDYVRYLSNALY